MANGARFRSEAIWSDKVIRVAAAEWLVLLPGVTLLAYWLGGEAWLMALAVGRQSFRC